MKIEDLKTQFLSYLVVYRGRSKNTQLAYDYDLSRFLKYLEARKINNLNLVTTKNIEEYLLSELTICAVTKARVRSSIKSFFGYLSRNELVDKNPASNLESIKLPNKNPAFLSTQQQSNLLVTVSKKATPYYRDRDLILIKLLFMTGLRRAEVLSLNVGDIDLSKRTISVRRKGNRESIVHIHDELFEELKKYLTCIDRKNDEALFLSKRGNRLSPSSLWHLIKTYSLKAGLNKNITVHSLRHSFATTLLNNGLPLPYIQELMDHKSSQTTARYLHFHNPELVSAFNKTTFLERK